MPLLQIVLRHAVQRYTGGELMATCVDVTVLGFELSLQRQKARSSTNRPSRRCAVVAHLTELFQVTFHMY